MKGELNEFSYLKAFCLRASPWVLRVGVQYDGFDTTTAQVFFDFPILFHC